MTIPGSDLLAEALTVINGTELLWYRSQGRAQDAEGNWVTSFADPVTVDGSWQPIDSSKYEYLGLDVQRSYQIFYTHAPIQTVEANKTPDFIVANGRKWVAQKDVSNWLAYDGWGVFVFIDEGPYAG